MYIHKTYNKVCIKTSQKRQKSCIWRAINKQVSKAQLFRLLTVFADIVFKLHWQTNPICAPEILNFLESSELPVWLLKRPRVSVTVLSVHAQRYRPLPLLGVEKG